MDSRSFPDDTKKAPRKSRFVPKAPPRRVPKPVAPKVEKTEADENDDANAQELLRRFREASVRVKGKDEKKAHVQVAFGHGGTSTYIRSFGSQKGGATSSRFGGTGTNASGLSLEKDYKEPWDYYKNYPSTLPLRRPYSGNPEVLNRKEFGEASESTRHNEQVTKSAVELGLMEEDLEPRLIFLQLPELMPMVKESANNEEKGPSNNSNTPKKLRVSAKLCRLNELPAGYMGKMLVYRSGAVKLKLGDTLYNVSGGLDCVFAQDVVAINAEQKHCCTLGELGKRAIVIPDVDSLLNRMTELL